MKAVLRARAALARALFVTCAAAFGPPSAFAADAEPVVLGQRAVDLAFGLAADRNGFVTGLQFAGPLPIGATRLQPGPRGGVALVRFSGGAPVLALELSPTAQAEVRATALGAGRLHGAGYFIDQLGLGRETAQRALGGSDAWIATVREDGSRSLLRFGGKGADGVLALAADGARLYAGGYFEHAARFGETAEGAPRVLTARGQDAVVLALDPRKGVVEAALAVGGARQDRVLALAPRDDGLLALVAVDGATDAGDACRAAPRGAATLLLALDRSLRCTRIALIEGPAPLALDQLAVDASGQVWVGGFHLPSRGLRVDGRDAALRDAAASSEVLLLRFDPTLGLRGVQRIGNDGPDVLRGIVASGKGVAIAAGGAGEIKLGRDKLELGRAGGYVARLDADGTVRSAVALTATGLAQPMALAAAPGGRLGVVGVYEKALVKPTPAPEARGKTDVFFVEIPPQP